MIDSLFQDSHIYAEIIQKITPCDFLAASDFDPHYFMEGADQQGYPQSMLSPLGYQRIEQEIRRLEHVYTIQYRDYISIDEFLSLYWYTTNSGYKIINSELRTGQDHHASLFIKYASSAMEKLKMIPQFQITADTIKKTEEAEVLHTQQITQILEDDSLTDAQKHERIEALNRAFNTVTLTRESNAMQAMMDQINHGKFVDLGFLSTSFLPEGVEVSGPKDLEMKIHLRGQSIGVNISDISPFPEGEYLILPRSTFYTHSMRSIVDLDSDTTTYHVVLNASNLAKEAKRVMNVQRASKQWKHFCRTSPTSSFFTGIRQHIYHLNEVPFTFNPDRRFNTALLIDNTTVFIRELDNQPHLVSQMTGFPRKIDKIIYEGQTTLFFAKGSADWTPVYYMDNVTLYHPGPLQHNHYTLDARELAQCIALCNSAPPVMAPHHVAPLR